MMAHCWSCMVLLISGMVAQQQTGSPAGIPVPSAPAAHESGPSTQGAGGSTVFRVRVLDGRNGLPIRSAHIKLWYDELAGSGYQLATDSAGYGDMPAPVGDPVRVLLAAVDYTDCRKPLRGAPAQGYNMSQIAKAGLAAQNICGAVSVHTRPGELVLFVRPAHWYEQLNRNAGT